MELIKFVETKIKQHKLHINETKKTVKKYADLLKSKILKLGKGSTIYDELMHGAPHFIISSSGDDDTKVYKNVSCTEIRLDTNYYIIVNEWWYLQYKDDGTKVETFEEAQEILFRALQQLSIGSLFTTDTSKLILREFYKGKKIFPGIGPSLIGSNLYKCMVKFSLRVKTSLK